MDRHTMNAQRIAMNARSALRATRVCYVFESTLASVSKAEQAASEAAALSGFDEQECIRIAAAVREAAVNAVVHGNRCDAAKHVTVSFESAPGSLNIAVRDEGSGFDPAGVADPLASENLLKGSGRGIFLMRAFMDQVRFAVQSPGSEVILTKFVRGESRGAKEPTQ
jgi:serine/threonine-protein kinase RsbW